MVRAASRRTGWQPLDRWAIALMAILALLTALLWGSGDHSLPRVRGFNWEGRQVGSMDQAMIFNFSRPMDRETVEQGFKLEPPLPGKFSWARRRMAYTLDVPLPYGDQEYRVAITGAKDALGGAGAREMEPFVGRFRSRDRAFVYIGVDGEEAGRLILYNLTQQGATVLTPENLVVSDFEPAPEGDRIVFSASDRQSFLQGLPDQQIYQVTTGLSDGSNPDQKPQSAGEVVQILDSQNYLNLGFDLAPNGKTLLVERAEKQNPGASFGLWIIQGNQAAKPFETAPGGEFLITPDSQSLVMAQGEGIAVLPLESGAKPIDFLPKFGQVLDFSPDGTQATMVKFNGDYTASLFWVTNQGIQKELWRLDGAVLQAQFDRTQTRLYCLFSKRIPGEIYQEQPFVAVLDLEKAKAAKGLTAPKTLYELPVNQRDVTLNLAPDGLALIFDQVKSAQGQQETGVRGSDGRAIAESRLWVLPLLSPVLNGVADTSVETPEAVSLPLQGLRPKWMP